MMEGAAGEQLPASMGFEWTELALQQKLEGNIRYAMTLEQVLKQSKVPQAEQVRREYEACRQAQKGPSDPAETPALRDRLVRWILQAQDQPLPAGFERRCLATRPAGFQPVDNEQM